MKKDSTPTTPTVESLLSREQASEKKAHIEKDFLPLPKKDTEIEGFCAHLPNIEKMKIETEEGEFYVEKESGKGKGHPLFLIHGGPGCTHHMLHPWFSLASEFISSIYYMDMRGCGESTWKEGNAWFNYEQIAIDINNVMGKLNIGKAILLGHSLGGLITAEFALKFPERVAGIINVCPSVTNLGMDLDFREFRYLTQEEETKIAHTKREPALDSKEKLYNNLLNGGWKQFYYYKPTMEEMARLAIYEINGTPKLQVDGTQTRYVFHKGIYERMPFPVYLYESSNDNVTGRHVFNIAKKELLYLGAEFFLFEKSGHMPYRDESELFFVKLQEAVEKINATEIDEAAVKSFKEFAEDHLKNNKYGMGKYMKFDFERARTTLNKDLETQIKGTGNTHDLLEIGKICYFAQKFELALIAFGKMREGILVKKENEEYLGIGDTWMGAVLDAMGKKEEAKAKYLLVLEGEELNQYIRFADGFFDILFTKEAVEKLAADGFTPKPSHFREFWGI